MFLFQVKLHNVFISGTGTLSSFNSSKITISTGKNGNGTTQVADTLGIFIAVSEVIVFYCFFFGPKLRAQNKVKLGTYFSFLAKIYYHKQ